jgi:hypothetical protein
MKARNRAGLAPADLKVPFSTMLEQLEEQMPGYAARLVERMSEHAFRSLPALALMRRRVVNDWRRWRGVKRDMNDAEARRPE